MGGQEGFKTDSMGAAMKSKFTTPVWGVLDSGGECRLQFRGLVPKVGE